MTNGKMDVIPFQIQYQVDSYTREKNIQADALSRRPDLCPERTDNENVVVLPEHLFANLINTELQRRIENTGNMDYDAAEAIKKLLGEGPNEAQEDVEDWKVEEFEGKNILFYKEQTTF